MSGSETVVECLCELDDAELLLTRAKVSYPLASSYIEKGIRLAQKPSMLRRSNIEKLLSSLEITHR